jgi:hypothetical protein
MRTLGGPELKNAPRENSAVSTAVRGGWLLQPFPEWSACRGGRLGRWR